MKFLELFAAFASLISAVLAVISTTEGEDAKRESEIPAAAKLTSAGEATNDGNSVEAPALKLIKIRFDYNDSKAPCLKRKKVKFAGGAPDYATYLRRLDEAERGE